jgi:hypothetical protein
MRLSPRHLAALFTCVATTLAATNARPLERPAASDPPSDTTIVLLGDSATLATLYSWPNNPKQPISLSATIAHYLTQTIQRDNIPGSVNVRFVNGQCIATLVGDSRLALYSTFLPTFLANGRIAADSVAAASQRSGWNPTWRMFLPLGLSLVNQKSVQLLHFPPDYTLSRLQNYLNSATSNRWEALLEENGIGKDSVTQYETIIDVAPIAANEAAGDSLPIAPFFPYAQRQLQLMFSGDSATVTKPLVAYGAPARQWVSAVYLGERSLGVDSATYITVLGGRTTPVLGANHPSYIWHFTNTHGDTSWAARHKAAVKATPTMRQDLTAACWQAKVSANRTLDIQATLYACREYWNAQPKLVCVYLWEQAYNMTPQQAGAACARSSVKRVARPSSPARRTVGPNARQKATAKP